MTQLVMFTCCCGLKQEKSERSWNHVENMVQRIRLNRAVQKVHPYMNVMSFPVATMSNMAGVWTVTVVTFHRYIAVCLPHRVTKFANLRVARLQASLP